VAGPRAEDSEARDSERKRQALGPASIEEY
jgi:hypothetical protein